MQGLNPSCNFQGKTWMLGVRKQITSKRSHGSKSNTHSYIKLSQLIQDQALEQESSSSIETRVKIQSGLNSHTQPKGLSSNGIGVC